LPHDLADLVLAQEPRRADEEIRPFLRRDHASSYELSQQLKEFPTLVVELPATDKLRGIVINLAGERAARSSYQRAGEYGEAERSAATIAELQNSLAEEGKRFDEELAKGRVALGLNVQKRASDARALAITAHVLRQAKLVTRPDLSADDGIAAPRRLFERDLEQALQIQPGEVIPERHLPALIQLLQPEELPQRYLLVLALARVKAEQADIALAERALYDPSPFVRQEAVQALGARRRETSRAVLLAGLRYPWAPVANHAAEALVALSDRTTLPALKKLVDEPNPSLPFKSAPGKKALMREVVRVNHLRNCFLCHAAGQPGDGSTLAAVPRPGVSLRDLYYDALRSRSGALQARVDAIFVKQDFSLIQRVKDAKPWPELQRFDFLIRTREATADEIAAAKKAPPSYPQREAVLWAIKELESGPAPPKP
jgi:hypothetical protein